MIIPIILTASPKKLSSLNLLSLKVASSKMSLKKLLQDPSALIKIVLFGPECTGKTTLSRQLADHYETEWVPEFLREFAQHKWDNEQKVCEEKDIMTIAQGQIRLENEASKNAHNLLICDTDLLETKVYAQTYFSDVKCEVLNQAIAHNHYTLYLLTSIDVPWQADDLRDRPTQRAQMFATFEAALISHHKPYVLLTGDESTRLASAIGAIEARMKR